MATTIEVLRANSLDANGTYWVSGDRIGDLMDLMYNKKHACVSPLENIPATSAPNFLHYVHEEQTESKGTEKSTVVLYPRRKKSKVASPREIVFDSKYVANFFHLPQPEAAIKMGISLSALKSVCRRVGVRRWPYKRQYTTNDSQGEEETTKDKWEEDSMDDFELFEEALRHVEGRAFKRRRSVGGSPLCS
eukprot:760297-Hanusia_phi.AAC.2